MYRCPLCDGVQDCLGDFGQETERKEEFHCPECDAHFNTCPEPVKESGLSRDEEKHLWNLDQGHDTTPDKEVLKLLTERDAWRRDSDKVFINRLIKLAQVYGCKTDVLMLIDDWIKNKIPVEKAFSILQKRRKFDPKD